MMTGRVLTRPAMMPVAANGRSYIFLAAITSPAAAFIAGLIVSIRGDASIKWAAAGVYFGPRHRLRYPTHGVNWPAGVRLPRLTGIRVLVRGKALLTSDFNLRAHFIRTVREKFETGPTLPRS